MGVPVSLISIQHFRGGMLTTLLKTRHFYSFNLLLFAKLPNTFDQYSTTIGNHVNPHDSDSKQSSQHSSSKMLYAYSGVSKFFIIGGTS
jgi:hypothetical protein